MIINLESYQRRRKSRESYRQALIDRIIAHHRLQDDRADDDSFFLDHVRNGFPVQILENIVARLDLKKVSGE